MSELSNEETVEELPPEKPKPRSRGSVAAPPHPEDMRKYRNKRDAFNLKKKLKANPPTKVEPPYAPVTSRINLTRDVPFPVLHSLKPGLVKDLNVKVEVAEQSSEMVPLIIQRRVGNHIVMDQESLKVGEPKIFNEVLEIQKDELIEVVCSVPCRLLISYMYREK